ncbi:methyltransferase domain-containing protein [Chitinophaga barathri]|nr:methyltransferase domain-containing protein [Chitinophaga barathri]
MHVYVTHPILLLKQIKKKVLGANQDAFMHFVDLFRDKIGLEIGGPSSIFQDKGYLPAYKFAKRVDGVNFSNSTVWEGNIEEGMSYRYATDKQGYQFINEGNDLSRIEPHQYDFILSSHNLEHFANPLKAVKEWHRVLKPGGAMLVILPDKRYTFDHLRPTTTMKHLKEDFQKDIGEDDLTHLEEILKLHDLSRDPGAREIDFEERSKRNFENRCLHHHVFDGHLVKEIYDYFNIETLFVRQEAPYNLIVMGRKKL